MSSARSACAPGARRTRWTRRASRLALISLLAASQPRWARAQINALAPTFSSLNGAAAWGSLGFGTGRDAGADDPALVRWGFAAFYGPFGGRGDTLVSFSQTISDSADTTGSAPGMPHPGPRVRTTRNLRGESRHLGGGKVTLLVGYQHSASYRFDTPRFTQAVPVGGIFVAGLLGPYPLPFWPRQLSWYGGLGGTIVRLSDISFRADTLAVTVSTERTLAPEVLGMLMYQVAPGYRVFLGASYEYLRFGSLSYRAGQPGDRIPAATLLALPETLELRSIQVSAGFSFASSGLIPGR